jgi:hypothetical protein
MMNKLQYGFILTLTSLIYQINAQRGRMVRTEKEDENKIIIWKREKKGPGLTGIKSGRTGGAKKRCA